MVEMGKGEKMRRSDLDCIRGFGPKGGKQIGGKKRKPKKKKKKK